MYYLLLICIFYSSSALTSHSEIKYRERQVLYMLLGGTAVLPSYRCIFNMESPISCNQSRNLAWSQTEWRHSTLSARVRQNDLTDSGTIKQKEKEWGNERKRAEGLTLREVMYRHQLSYCSWHSQGHKSIQFPDNGACTLYTHARTEQGDNTPPTVLLFFAV